MAAPNLAFLLVMVGSFGRLAGSAFALPQNDDRRFLEGADKSSLPKAGSLKSGKIALYLDQPPKDITKGFVFGSEQRTCDVLLADNKETGISGNHFSIHIDWVSRDPRITCLSGNSLRAKVTTSRTSTILTKNTWQRLESGTTVDIVVTADLGVSLSVPNREDLQAAYDGILEDYFTVFKNAVPELANISLRETDATPFILDRCPGLTGKEYYTTGKFETGDRDYDTKVFLYRANRKVTQDTRTVSQGGGGYKDTADWLLKESKGDRASELCVVKHFQREGKTHGFLPSRYRELCHLNHLNLEDLVDLIIEPSAFVAVTATFFNTTLHALQQEEPLSTEEVGNVVGQIFAALEYLHDRDWVHGNVDPRSIHVQSRKHLWVKLVDTGLSEHLDLGKPDGYHRTYASQHIARLDRSPADIWSAGVVALELILPNGLAHRKPKPRAPHRDWLKKLELLAAKEDRESGNEATALVSSVLKREVGERPTAAEVLKYRWIENTKRGPFVDNPLVDNPNLKFPTPGGSRASSSAPTPSFSREGSDPPLEVSRQSSVVPTEIFSHQALEAMDKERKLSSDYIDYDDIDWNTLNSPNSLFTRNQPPRESPALDDDPVIYRSVRPQPRIYRIEPPSVISQHGVTASRRDRGAPKPSDFDDKTIEPISLRLRSSSGRFRTPLSDCATGRFGPVKGQEKVRIEEDSGEETETGERRRPVMKKPRKEKSVPPPHWEVKSRRKSRA